MRKMEISEPKGKSLIMVLNDGETFTGLQGCKIYAVPEDSTTDEVEEGLKDEKWESVIEF